MNYTTHNLLRLLSFKKGRNRKVCIFFFCLLISCSIHAQTAAQAHNSSFDDEKLINSYIDAKGYGSIIQFNASNIKSFWIEKSVLPKDSSIQILLRSDKDGNWESVPLKIQLANVNETQDCSIDVIAEDSDFTLSVYDNKLNKISPAPTKETFIRYHVLSTSFHLEDTQNTSFYIKFNSNKSATLSIKRIVLSFSNNQKSIFSFSPGNLQIKATDFNINRSISSVKKKSETEFSVSGKLSDLVVKNKIFVQDNTFNISVKVKNIGDIPTKIFLGFSPYSKDGTRITNRNSPYKNGKTFNIISSEVGSNKVVIDAYPEWIKNCFLVLDAKDDFSDFTNLNFFENRIVSISKINDAESEITFEKVLTKKIPSGTSARIHSPYANSFIYVSTKTLEPGEEAVLTGTIKKDNDSLLYSPKAFCRGTYYVQPILLSYSVSPTEENTVQISDFSVSY